MKQHTTIALIISIVGAIFIRIHSDGSWEGLLGCLMMFISGVIVGVWGEKEAEKKRNSSRSDNTGG